MPAAVFIFRVGIYGVDGFGHRWMVAETYHAPQVLQLSQMTNWWSALTGHLALPFGAGANLNYGTPGLFLQLLYPASNSFIYTRAFVAPGFGPVLNPNAREAAFRLQRVGAGVGSMKYGRINYPILSDAFFTDLPRRRHVDVAFLRPKLAAATLTWPKTVTVSFGLQITNCIWHRRTRTYDPVTSWQLLENPTRYWQRWRSYPPPTHTAFEDQRWAPPPPLDEY